MPLCSLFGDVTLVRAQMGYPNGLYISGHSGSMHVWCLRDSGWSWISMQHRRGLGVDQGYRRGRRLPSCGGRIGSTGTCDKG